MNKSVKKVLFISCFFLLTLCLVGCSNTVYGVELEGINVIWTPFLYVWNWFFNDFTHDFWDFLKGIWDSVPSGLAWLAGCISYTLGAILYAFMVIIVFVLDVILAVITGVAWFFAAIGNAIFKIGK